MALSPLPPGFSGTRDALHQIAFFAMAPARHEAVGRMGLKAMPGGFGTPEFEGRVARVEGDFLVHEQDGNISTQQITTVRAAADFFGARYEVEWFDDFHDPLQPADPDEALTVDRDAALALGLWFEFGFEVLNRLREQGDDSDDVTETQLWPEHFDPATELGDQDKGQRASFGASPGDPATPEPYIYVAAWSHIDRSNDYWNNDSFNGASLGYEGLASADDPVERGLEFLLEGYRILHSE
jgi:hypothetical protein